ncbi:testis-expressed protein 47 [Coregonus clupeaformis]|uniref:testis-expressed protein 47 n=1 Tax=Coregonus clupeaformis TaxID=59861 RepID=UPI001BE0009D|nr:testis-expressed protein 47 [Coregonus clupeaformis]
MAVNPLPSSLPGSVNPYFNAYKNSLFTDVEKQKTTCKKRFIHRLVYVATRKLNADDNQSAIAEYYEQFLSKFQKNIQTEKVTGILLLYPKSIIHLMESSSEVLHMILEDLNEMEKIPKCPLKEVRILVVSHCVLRRMFPLWGYRFVTLPLSLQDPNPQTQPVETLVPDSLAMIYKMCVCLLKRRGSGSGQDDQEQALLLEEDTVIYLCQSPVLHSPSTFLQTYTKPTNILMDSEIVWPTHRRLYW